MQDGLITQLESPIFAIDEESCLHIDYLIEGKNDTSLYMNKLEEILSSLIHYMFLEKHNVKHFKEYQACVEDVKRELITSTALASLFGCLLMGIFANLPVALAPGMGMNAYFT